MVARMLVKLFGSVWNLKKLCNDTKNIFFKNIYLQIYSFYQYENNSSIAWNSTFDGVPCFPHGMKSIFISGDAKIGKNCVIFQQVTIGSNMLLDSKGLGAPEIGNNCYIGAGAKIIGNIKIGNNVRVGANAVVYKDVSDNCVVLSAKQVIITKDTPMDNRFYSYHGQWVYFEGSIWVPVVDVEVLSRLEGKE